MTTNRRTFLTTATAAGLISALPSFAEKPATRPLRIGGPAFTAQDDPVAFARWHRHFVEVPPGKGLLDYGTYLRRLAQLPDPPPLMLEHLRDADSYAVAAKHLFETARANGLTY
ncbi:MAG: hypothetical protein J6334_07410 [Kiritimatiellae bacterium]|nr:hypothetical protein [Kiritimatiellia bacterium]